MTDPTDETQPHTTSPGPTSGPPEDAHSASPRAPDAPRLPEAPAPAAAPAGSSLRVDPDAAKDSGWREPAWFPPRDKDRGPSVAALVVGVVLVVIGLYFFLDRTLGLPMPRIQWSTIWPILLIGLGAIVLFRSVSRRS